MYNTLRYYVVLTGIDEVIVLALSILDLSCAMLLLSLVAVFWTPLHGVGLICCSLAIALEF